MINKRILYVVVFLVLFGNLMIYSASSIWAEYKFGDKYYFLTRQMLFTTIGFVAMYFISKVNYRIYKQKATLIFFITLALLILVLIPGIGLVRGGAQSWIGVGNFSIQPSEFMKFSLVVLLSKYLSTHYKDLQSFKYLIGTLMIVITVFGLIMLQPDFGTGIVILLGCVLLLFTAGVLLRWFVYFSMIGVVGIVGLVISAPYRLERILSFLDPWKDPLGSGFQIIQSLYAIAPGGIFGHGLFNSRQKYYYLPEPQTDFIFAIITEELGLIGGVILITLFCYLCIKILLLAIKTTDLFAQFLCIGIGSMLFVQFFINIAVVIGLIPVTGITLPLISYGGSSLVITLMMLGVVLNISKEVK